MPVGVYQLTLVTGATGAGTASTRSLSGELLAVRMSGDGAAVTGPGATALFTLTDGLTGGTFLTLGTAAGAGSFAAPFEYRPRKIVQTQTGGTTVSVAGSAALYDPSGIAFAGTITATYSQGGSAGTAVLYLHYRR